MSFLLCATVLGSGSGLAHTQSFGADRPEMLIASKIHWKAKCIWQSSLLEIPKLCLIHSYKWLKLKSLLSSPIPYAHLLLSHGTIAKPESHMVAWALEDTRGMCGSCYNYYGLVSTTCFIHQQLFISIAVGFPKSMISPKVNWIANFTSQCMPNRVSHRYRKIFLHMQERPP